MYRRNKSFQVPLNGATVITFYDQSRSFTSQDFRNGTLQSWLEGVYLSWRQLNPCSQNQAENNVLQTTVQQTTQNATQAATQAATSVPVTPNVTVNAPPPTTSTPPTPAAPTPVDTTPEVQTPVVESTPSVDSTPEPTVSTESTGSGSSGAETPSDTSNESAPAAESSEAESTPVESSETQEDSSPSSESSDETTTEDNGGDSGDGETSEETQESESESEVEETSEETTEEESTEETTEEESSEEESTEEESSEEEQEEETTEEEDSEESSEESEEEEEKEKKKKKKRNTAPPIIVANVSSMQGIDGKFQQAFTMGLSKSSLKGDKSYGVTSMVWSNLKQYMLMGTFSKLFFKEGRPYLVYSAGLGASKMYTTVIGMNNHSLVYLGKKGLVAGTSLGVTSIYLNYDITRDAIIFDDNIVSGNATLFATKPFNFGRFTVSPMLAASKQILNYTVYGEQSPVSKDLMYITGTSVNFSLTKRFVANLGANLINNTNKDIRSTLTFTIGSRFNF